MNKEVFHIMGACTALSLFLLPYIYIIIGLRPILKERVNIFVSDNSMKSFLGKYLTWVLIVLVQIVGHESCREKERMGLLQFKMSVESMNEDANWLLPSWVDDPQSDCCGWERVICNSTTRRITQLSLNNIRHVEYGHKLLGYTLMNEWFLNVSLFTPFEELVSLDLSENWFKGCLDNEGFEKLWTLKKLEILNLAMNDLDNSILPSLGSLTTLKRLVLRETKLQGSSPATELANLRNLEMLDLSYCYLNSQPESLQMEGFERLSTLKKLQTLTLDSTGFDNRIFSYLSSFSFLKNLSLSQNQLWGSFPPRDLATLRNLEILNLRGNNFNESLREKGSRSISNFRKLVTLDLGSNQFNMSIFHSLSALPSLRNLMLGSNNLSGPFPAKELANFGHLETLDLSNTSLSGPLMMQEFTNLRNLKILILRGNQLGGTIAVQAFNNLEVLDLRKNHFIGSIPPSVWDMSSLRVLSLANNEFNGTLPIEGFCNLKNLQELDLSLNFFEGKLPHCLGYLKSLRVLDLSMNQFTGNVTSSLISNLTSLEYIDISYNLFEGILSLSSFANHSKLEGVILSSDNDSFEVETDHTSWVPKFQLKVLVLSHCNLNKLTGNIPKFLSQQYKLVKLDLSNNDLKGEFPKWILENNRILEFLNVRKNSLSGKFPLPSYPNKYIGWLDVSNNHFGGSLEGNFGEIFPFTAYLNLSGNAFEGPIPYSIGNKSVTEALDLSGNNFSGEVPEQLIVGCINLSVLKLSENNLHGQIFSTQFNMPALQLLHLDNNQFTGTLSNGLSKCSQLLLLDVSNNYMSGEVPRWIHDMKNLSTLIMRNNSFHGQVPYQLESIQFFDLSHNLFTGSLPSLSILQYVQHVHLQGNRFTGSIPENFLNASGLLITLDLGNNDLSGHVPNSIGAFSNVRVLSLRGNNFTGGIPNSLCQLSRISIMDLSYNSFTGPIPHCFSNMTFGEIGVNDHVFVQHFLSGLERFAFYLYTHPDLEKYFINLHERTNGSHSHELDAQLDEQDQIDFITKSRPSTYKGGILNYMSGLDLSCNNLTGEIPGDLGLLSWIHALNLSHNWLTGSIPRSFSNLSQLESLDLSYNNLSGKIPSELTDLHFLAVFTVAHNNLSGRIPDMEAQFGTFDESSYDGNPFLCGPLLTRKCDVITESTHLPTTSLFEGEEKWYKIDPVIFTSSFVASYIIILSGFVALLYINPYWRRRWFDFIEECLYSCYYFVVDTLHKLSTLLFK